MASNFKKVSMGIVLADKPADSWEIEVKPHESNGLSDGLLSTEIKTQEVTGVNHAGESYSETVNAVHGILAKWYPDQANRLSAPDVKAGELVELWKYADSDQYYWRSSNLNHANRDKETITIAAANKPKKDKLKLDATNSYFMEMCTRTKQVTLKTNKSDGEPFAYTIQVNTKTGAVVITDDVGNYIQLDSEENTIELFSNAGSSVKVNENILFETNGNIVGTAKGNIDFTAKGSVTMKATGAYNVQSASYLIKSANFNATSGGATFSTNLDINGKLNNNGVNVGSTHQHLEQGDGKLVSVPQ
jgi:hypothetical protein